PGTTFWISGPTLTDLSSIKSIVAGPSIGILPSPGRVQREDVALAAAPLMEGVVAGRTFLLHAVQLGNLARGSSVFFRDLWVGTVQSTKLRPDQTIDILHFVEHPTTSWCMTIPASGASAPSSSRCRARDHDCRCHRSAR
ncbi:MAG: hypothetical protein JOY66_00980, partial [Acetobacteraceae bacterium]|nr:hypothetical protein [Acetobacteraceae bacterium]